MADNYLKSLIGLGCSRPFLLFVIILLTGYIYLHFSASGNQLNVSPEAFRAPKVQIKQTNELQRPDSPKSQQKLIENISKILFNDTLEPMDKNVRTGWKCRKKTDVSFLKVHKAGSTTIMNIFLRFAISNRLNIVLPPKPQGYGFNYLGYGRTVSKDRVVPIPNNESYNILCNHVVYNKPAFRSIMPEDTVYVGILREPKSHFRSAAAYYGFHRHLKDYANGHGLNPRSNVISEFLRDETQFKVGTYFVYNRMSFDFGIAKHLFHNDSFVDAYIEELGRDYGIVMIMEKFPESLVLLKRLLCWNTKDILYVPLNAGHSRPEFDLTDEDTTRLKLWNSADFKLYDHFSRIFDEKLKAGGPDLLEEIQSFSEIQDMVKEFCNSWENPESVLAIPKTKWEESFEVKRADCDLMTESELPMMRRLITQAWDRYRQAASEAKDALDKGEPVA